jgi:hypothetical protein
MEEYFQLVVNGWVEHLYILCEFLEVVHRYDEGLLHFPHILDETADEKFALAGHSQQLLLEESARVLLETAELAGGEEVPVLVETMDTR